MELLLKKTLEILLNEGGGATSLLLLANIYFIWRLLKQFDGLKKSVAGLDDMIKKELADIELVMVKKYVDWEVFSKLRDEFNTLKNEVSKILGRMNGGK